MWIAVIDGDDGGLLQSYLHVDYPEHDECVGIARAVGIDYLIAGHQRGRGRGREVLREFARVGRSRGIPRRRVVSPRLPRRTRRPGVPSNMPASRWSANAVHQVSRLHSSTCDSVNRSRWVGPREHRSNRPTRRTRCTGRGHLPVGGSIPSWAHIVSMSPSPRCSMILPSSDAIDVHDGEVDVDAGCRRAHEFTVVATPIVTDRRHVVALGDDDVELVASVGEGIEERLAEGHEAGTVQDRRAEHRGFEMRDRRCRSRRACRHRTSGRTWRRCPWEQQWSSEGVGVEVGVAGMGIPSV